MRPCHLSVSSTPSVRRRNPLFSVYNPHRRDDDEEANHTRKEEEGRREEEDWTEDEERAYPKKHQEDSCSSNILSGGHIEEEIVEEIVEEIEEAIEEDIEALCLTTIVHAESTWCTRESNQVDARVMGTAEAIEEEEEALTAASSSSSYPKRITAIVILLLLLGMLSAMGWGVWKYRSSHHTNKPPPEEIPQATEPPTDSTSTLFRDNDTPHKQEELCWTNSSLGEYHQDLLKKVQALVEETSEGLLNSYHWQQPSSSQSKALRFVVTQDGSLPGGGDMGCYHHGRESSQDGSELNGSGSGSSELLLQRLALLVLYYETGGGFSWSTRRKRILAERATTSYPNTDRRGPNGESLSFSHGEWPKKPPSGRRFLDQATRAFRGSTILQSNQELTRYSWATPGVDECFWEGIACDEFFRVTHVDAAGVGLWGSLPDELWVWLPHLEVLNLSRNELEGRLPTNLWWPQHPPQSNPLLPRLRILDLSSNRLEGSLPRDWKHGLFSLQRLDLSKNLLTGFLPWRFRVGVLEQLSLASNALRGPIPWETWTEGSNGNQETGTAFHALAALDLQDNWLTGKLDAHALGTWSNLEVLNLQQNLGLGGSLPTDWSLLTKLRTLLLADGGWNGSITSSLVGLLGLANLERLSLASNQLTGSLPTLEQITVQVGVAGSSALELLDIGNNYLTGSIPGDLLSVHLQHLESLQLYSNRLEGTIPTMALTKKNATSLHPSLKTLWLQNNPFLEGTMPCPSEISLMTPRNETELPPSLMAPDISYDYMADCHAAVSGNNNNKNSSSTGSDRVVCSCCAICA